MPAWLWAVSLLCLSAAALFWNVPFDDEQVPEPERVASDDRSSLLSPSAEAHSTPPMEKSNSPEMLLRRAQLRRPLTRLDSDRLLASSGKQMIMTAMGSQQAIAALGNLSDRQKADGRKFVAYDSYVLEGRGVGDRVEILIPAAGVALGGIIDSVETVHADGIGSGEILRWQGKFPDMPGSPNSFSITQVLRDGYAVAVYETPFGTYNMESRNGVGWVVRQEDDFHLPEDGNDAIRE